MFTDSPFEIEASDLDALVRAGDAIKLPDGRVALPVLLVLRDDAGKTFGADASADFPTAMHLAAGASVRRMLFEHLGAAVIVAQAMPAANEPTDAAPEAPEASSSDEAPATSEPAPEVTTESAPATDAATDVSAETESAPEPAEAPAATPEE